VKTSAEDLNKRRFACGNSEDRGQTGGSVGHGVGKNLARFVGVSESDAVAAGHSRSHLLGPEGHPHSSRNCQGNGRGDSFRFSLNSILANQAKSAAVLEQEEN
jgi:hypothetical protein